MPTTSQNAPSMPSMFNLLLCFIYIYRQRIGRDNKAPRKRWIRSFDRKLRKGTAVSRHSARRTPTEQAGHYLTNRGDVWPGPSETNLLVTTILFIPGWTHGVTAGNGEISPSLTPLTVTVYLQLLPSLADWVPVCRRTSAFILVFMSNYFLPCAFHCRKRQDFAVESVPSGDTTSTEPTAPASISAAATRKRQRLDLTPEPRERKRGGNDVHAFGQNLK